VVEFHSHIAKFSMSLLFEFADKEESIPCGYSSMEFSRSLFRHGNLELSHDLNLKAS
jgi:hypothetical protein